VGPDLAFECAGIPSTIQQSADWVRRGGTVALVGMATLPAEIQPGSWLARETRLVATLAYGHEEFALTLGLIQDGRIQTGPLHTKTVGLDGMADAFALLTEDPTEIKILVDPRRS
jgi:(R,R)-butanediol dehydrogenase/meso-butanediol dehydrogenase/diacetyl reductase